MANSRLVIFDIESLLQLLTHYSEGKVPIDATPVSFQVSQKLPRWISLVAESDEWAPENFETGDGYNTVQPLFIRYEGKRIMVLNHAKDTIQWSEPDAIEAPTRQ